MSKEDFIDNIEANCFISTEIREQMANLTEELSSMSDSVFLNTKIVVNDPDHVRVCWRKNIHHLEVEFMTDEAPYLYYRNIETGVDDGEDWDTQSLPTWFTTILSEEKETQ